MTTETLSPPEAKSTYSGAIPSDPGLEIQIECVLDDATERAYDKYHVDCCKFERRATGVHDSRLRLLNGALDEKLRVTLDAAAKLNTDRATIERELVALRWRRFGLLPKLVPAFKQAVADADAAYDKSIAEARAMYAENGIDASSMPAGDANHLAAERQLMIQLRQEFGPLAAKSVQKRSEDALRVLHAQTGNPPTEDACRIDWQGAPAGIASDIARIAGLDTATPTVQPPPQFSDRGRRILREVGLLGRPLTPAHVNTVNAIDKALPVTDTYRPLAKCPATKLKEVRELLATLPQTQEIKRYLADTKNGPVHHHV